jgi:hypothetical protein
MGNVIRMRQMLLLQALMCQSFHHILDLPTFLVQSNTEFLKTLSHGIRYRFGTRTQSLPALPMSESHP